MLPTVDGRPDSHPDVDDMSAESSRLRQAVWLCWLLFAVVLAATVLFFRLGVLPVQVWDEARLANNALEMSANGLSIVTTYDGRPDHWNTKPPLLIWSMAASIQAFGPSEWSIRLPSAVAGLLTAIIVFCFCAIRLGRPAVGFVAVLALLSSPGYVQGTDFWTNPGELLQNHAARSGNYDVTLALFTTIYLLAGYLGLASRTALHRGWIVACAAGVYLAFLTKTVQGLIFLPALVAYAVYRGHFRSLLASRTMWLCVVTVILGCAAYYLARERADPGFIQSAIAFDVLRYKAVSDGHHGHWSYYLTQYRLFPMLVPFLVIGAVQALSDNGERRELSIFVLGVSAFYLVAISLSATKLWWYAIPLTPLSAVAVAVASDQVAERLAARSSMRSPGLRALLLSLLFVPLTLFVAFRNIQLAAMGEATAESRPQDLYSYFLRDPVMGASDLQKFVVLHPGYSRDIYYVAPTLFYVGILRSKGRRIIIQAPEVPIPAGFDTAVICGGEIDRASTSGLKLSPILEKGGCGAYRLM
jgi:4-amino-4-deoxy-L-arabinose transferase-like glycosyltransferase